MSVALVVTDTEGHDSLKPVATESVFNREWLPIAEKNNLQFIKLFSTGLPVQQEDIPYILDEMTINDVKRYALLDWNSNELKLRP